MKTARKVLIMALCAVLLVSATVMGTMAYLTKTTGTVTNTFTVGNVGFAVSGGLDEAKVDEYGVPATGAAAARVTANTYKLIPGHTYTKDPTIHMSSDTEDCYLFVEVVNQIAGLEATGDTTIAAQMAALGWKPVTGVNNIYIYAGTAADATKTPVSANANVVVFNSFTLADDADVGSVNTATTAITIKAYAVQADGLGDKTPLQIWNAAFGS